MNIDIHSGLSREIDGTRSIGEILADFRGQVADSGIGDDELDGLFTQARDEAHRERSRRSTEDR